MYLRHNNWIWTLALAVITTCLMLLSPHKAVAADTGNYPYAAKPCVHAPYAVEGTGVQWCAGYDWGDRPNDISAANVISPFGYYYRNCTDYVAWRVAGQGIAPAQYKGLGNAKEWATPPSTNGLRVDATPAIGAAAVRTSGSYGHVAYVEAIQGETITVAQYNKHGDGTFSVQSGTPAALGFTQFVHFEAYMPQAQPIAQLDAVPVPVAAATPTEQPEAAATEPELLPQADPVSLAMAIPAGTQQQAVTQDITPVRQIPEGAPVVAAQPPPLELSTPTPPAANSEPQPEPMPQPQSQLRLQPDLEPDPPPAPIALFTASTAVPSRWWQQPRGSPPSIGYMPAAVTRPSYWPLLGLVVLCILQTIVPVKMFTVRSP